MTISLRFRVTGIIALVVATLGVTSSLLFISTYRKSLEREVVARGFALSEALARSIDESLAAENLNLIKQVEDIVHVNDVVLVQVFSTLWLGVAAVPTDQLKVPPHRAALEHFDRMRGGHTEFSVSEGAWIDVYSPVFLDVQGERTQRKLLIGYVRLRIADVRARRALGAAVAANIGLAALLSAVAGFVLNAILGKSVLRPLLELHAAILKHRQGEFPGPVAITGAGEIRELSAEFNRMSGALREREERLADEKERLAVTLRSIGDGVIVADVDGRVTLINRAAEESTGWTTQEANGRSLTEVFPVFHEKTREPHANLVRMVLGTGRIVALENHTVLLKRGGGELVIEDSAAPIRDRDSRIIGVVIVFRDSTQKRRMEEELLNAEKLRSVGLLAGGIAHDFNNLLTGIVGNVTLAKMYLDRGSKAFERLSEAESASRRATDLTQQLLTFAKGGAPVRKTVAILDLIKEAAGFVLSGTNVAAQFDVPPRVWCVEVDAGQMSQVFNNLLINAVQAMPDGGTIRIEVGNVVLAANQVPTLKEGAYVRVAVRDEGSGIPPEHLPQIFDPYFTTKQKGSGLGLASSYSVIKRHDGHITVESQLGRGTTFVIHLPASDKEAAHAGRDDAHVAGGQGRVLVMDDETIVREVAGEMLAALGYDADFARDGAEAIERYRCALQQNRRFDLVIMDLTVPGGLGGKEAIASLLALDPAVKAIVSSGYSSDPVMANFGAYGFTGVISKPYSLKSFGAAIDGALRG